MNEEPIIDGEIEEGKKKMSALQKTLGINLLLVLVYAPIVFAVVVNDITDDRYIPGAMAATWVTSWVMMLHALGSMVTGGIVLVATHKKTKGNNGLGMGLLISGVIILVIGLSACFAPILIAEAQ